MFSSQDGRWRLRHRCPSQSLHVSVPQLQLHSGLSSGPSHATCGFTAVCRHLRGGERSKLRSGSGGLLRLSLSKPWISHTTVSHPKQVRRFPESLEMVCGMSWQKENVIVTCGPFHPLFQVPRRPPTGVCDWERLIPEGSFHSPVLSAQ